MWRRGRVSGGGGGGAASGALARWLRRLAPWLGLWLALRLAPLATAAVDTYCDESQIAPDKGVLEETRRANKMEGVRLGMNLRLRCCVRNYDQILWYREDNDTQKRVQLPRPENSSLVELLDNNRTLQSTSSQERDRGHYVCEARNKTAGSSITQKFQVKVKVDKPLDNRVLQDIHEERIQRIGDKVKIDCSMFTATVPIVWFRNDSTNKTFPNLSIEGNELPNVRVVPLESLNTSEIAETRKVKGQSIVIDPIRPENFGQYDCYNKTNIIRTVILKEGGYQKELKVAVICLSTLFMMVAVLGPCFWYWRIEILLFWKDRFGKLEENDDKEYDIFVSYDAVDASFVLGILVPILEEHFQYNCYAWERDSVAGDWIPEKLVQSVRDSRRFLMILSPALLENRWCTFALHVALKAVLQLRLHIICVKLQDIDWSQVQLVDKSASETIRQVLHVVRTVEWEPSKKKSMVLHNQQLMRDKGIIGFNKVLRRKNDSSEDDIRAPGRSRFWRKLRLYLPPRRTLPLLSKPPASPTSTKSLLSLPHASDYC